ncbi:hypothetical protein VCRA2114E365_10331 [Vibrio crassostreae]|nr:hypothetical protein VCRA2113O120_130011 [Vibrio crassostreae]CAK1757326.1 hypothetical protein VCRA2119O381_120066 [Vibrio crassostreae]CAK1824416.1 hypothetical protein VCRA2112O187_160013 [Vibrio crassostreae]CAK1856321.1 hypothetical protein VCRA2114O367_10171 [Vibrio crassostreae]CAK1858269.1 hypothetical protein VCRA2115O371_10331 [Vibrio crassostreae]
MLNSKIGIPPIPTWNPNGQDQLHESIHSDGLLRKLYGCCR